MTFEAERHGDEARAAPATPFRRKNSSSGAPGEGRRRPAQSGHSESTGAPVEIDEDRLIRAPMARAAWIGTVPRFMRRGLRPDLRAELGQLGAAWNDQPVVEQEGRSLQGAGDHGQATGDEIAHVAVAGRGGGLDLVRR